MMNQFVGEMVGTAFLIILGNGVVANVVLNQTKGNNSGWIVITMGWAMAVFVGVFVAASSSGAHLNPAVTIALASLGKTEWSLVPIYVSGQLIGAMIGQLLVWFSYRGHYESTTDHSLIQATFFTSPAIRQPANNFITEMIGTLVLVLGVLFLAAPTSSLGSLDALPVALLVLGIGLGLGGPTGYAINPARDLGPRLVYTFLPLKSKSTSDWQYSWIPVIGPISGGLIASLIFQLLRV